MILDVLTLHNFRQYYGTQKIYFSQDKIRNITVIHGENGSGKTALLGALGWCLFGESNLPDKEDIICERAAAEAAPGAELEAYIKVQFKDDAKSYFVTRRVRARKRNNGELEYSPATMELEYIDETGETKAPKNPQDTIDQIIPADLRSYFFFDGERIDNLTKKEGVKDIRKAIKIMMGLEILERGEKHLEQLRKTFRDESVRSGSTQAQDLGKDIRDLESQITAKDSERDNLLKNGEALDNTLTQVRDQLRSLEDSREAQTRKDELLAIEQQIKGKITEVRKKLRTSASKRGYLAFCADLIESTRTTLNDKREKNEIPSGLKQQFVDDLLDRGECICGTTLTPGTGAHDCVSAWRKRASSKELEDAFIELTGDVKVLEQDRPRLFEELQRLQGEKVAFHQSLKETQEELSQLKAQLEGRDVEEVAALARRERELEDLRRDTYQAIGRVQGEMDSLETHKKKKEGALKDLKAQDAKAELARRRMTSCENVKNTIGSILEVQSAYVQDRLQEKISDVYSKMLRKGYEVVIDENYMLSVFKVMGEHRLPVRMSQGERQITSLAFIGALVDIAREQYEREKERSVYFKGGYYPIVMDSPFGQLDEDHQERIASGIPGLAQQIIVMVSSSQWSESVAKGMQPFVGREYTLDYKSPEVDRSTQFEYTAVKEGKHA
ncbi:MAG TPA: AAA family ATPase [Symbiobacteriaceae bacterium]|jgi:DNA sulfur modification protein DndD